MRSRLYDIGLRNEVGVGHGFFRFARLAPSARYLVSEIQSKGGRANAVSVDLGIPDGAALLAKHVRSIIRDRLDVLVLNAGISKAARIADSTVEDFDDLFATNVRSPFFLVQQLLPILAEGSKFRKYLPSLCLSSTPLTTTTFGLILPFG